MRQIEMFGKLIAEQKDKALVNKINEAKKNPKVMDDPIFRNMAGVFPIVFENAFADFQIDESGFISGAWKLHPFDTLKNGVCDLGQFSLTDEFGVEFEKDEYEETDGFFHTPDVEVHEDALLTAKFFSIAHRPARVNNKDAWLAPPSFPSDSDLGVNITMEDDEGKFYRSIDVPERINNTKPNVVTEVYNFLLSDELDSDDKIDLNARALNLRYGWALNKFPKKFVLSEHDNGYLRVTVDEKEKMKLKSFTNAMNEKSMHRHISRFASLPDPFGPTWYLNLAFTRPIKQVLEYTVNLYHLAKMFKADQEVDVFSCDQIEPVILTMPDSCNVHYCFMGQVSRTFDGKKHTIKNKGKTGKADFVVDYKVVPQPVANNDSLLCKAINNSLKEEVNDNLSLGYTKGAFRVDYRLALTVESSRVSIEKVLMKNKDAEEKNFIFNELLFLNDFDPLSGKIWCFFGLKEEVKNQMPIKPYLVSGINARYSQMVYGTNFKKVMLSRFPMPKITFVFKDINAKDAEMFEEKEADVGHIMKKTKKAKVENAIDAFRNKNKETKEVKKELLKPQGKAVKDPMKLDVTKKTNNSSPKKTETIIESVETTESGEDYTESSSEEEKKKKNKT